MKRRYVWVGPLLVAITGCNQPNERLNAPPHGEAERTSEMQGTYVYMMDNALLADMTMSDMHFLPHRARLTDLGERRLSRMAELVQEYGGEIRYSTNEDEGALVSDRQTTIRTFLKERGMDVVAERVREDIPGGRGMRAAEVLTFKLPGACPKDAGGTTAAAPGAGSTP